MLKRSEGKTINHIIDSFSLIDMWRDKHPTLKQFTWHSSHKTPIFSRLDYFLVSENVLTCTVSCEHKINYRSGSGCSKLTTSLVNETLNFKC